MSELQAYYESFRQGHWATDNAEECLCRGHGWALSDVDTWHQCPIHYKGQLHPEVETESQEEYTRMNDESMARHAARMNERQTPPPPADDSDIPF